MNSGPCLRLPAEFTAGRSPFASWKRTFKDSVPVLIATLAAATALHVQGQLSPPARTVETVRLGISMGTRPGINPNDANAAILTWARTIFTGNGLPVETESRAFESIDSLAQALRSDQLDGVSIVTDEFLSLEDSLKPDSVLVATQSGSPYEHYVLLTRRDSGFEDVAGLRGRSIALQHTSRAALAHAWLDVVLSPPELPLEGAPLRAVRLAESPSRAVLRVFFRQVDAGVVTSNAFVTACDLNPQLRHQLRVVAVSPPLIPTLFFFRRTYSGRLRDTLESAILNLPESVSGRQILAVFQCERMIRLPLDCLASTRELLDRRRCVATRSSPAETWTTFESSSPPPQRALAAQAPVPPQAPP